MFGSKTRRALITVAAASVRQVEAYNNLSHAIERSNQELADRMSENSRNEIKARDRVDISLEEYEQMRDKLKCLSEENVRLRMIFKSMKIPVEVANSIIPKSIATEQCRNLMNYTTRWHVTFDVDDTQIF